MNNWHHLKRGKHKLYGSDSTAEQKSLSFETGNTVTSGRFQKTLIECYQKCCQYCSLYSVQNGKNCCQCPRAQKKKGYSSYLNQSEEHTLREGDVRRGRGRLASRGGWEGRDRDSLLMSIWWVFSWSRDLFVLLLFPESSIPPVLHKRGSRLRIRRRCRVGLVIDSRQRRLIGSSRIDPRSFSYLICDLILLSGPFDIYLNAMHP